MNNNEPEENAGGLKRQVIPAHERIYRKLRRKILIGEFLPGHPVTLRGLAESMHSSLTPVREAVRRLTAERALQTHDNRRVSIPAMSMRKFDEILTVRTQLEPRLGTLALENLAPHDIDSIEKIDFDIDANLNDGDVRSYVANNYAFHFSVYRHSNSQVLLPIVEGAWVQLGPFMRTVYGRWGTATLDDFHKELIAALRQKDDQALRSAIVEDITQGMSLIGNAELARAN